jgi:hypothetical protein
MALKKELPKDDREILGTRLSMAQAYTQMLSNAFDALLHWGVNYMDLPSYLDQTLVTKAASLKVPEGRALYIQWIERLEHDIAAAVRRKQFKLTTTKKDT